ncbi:MAG: hypothetical protein R3282_06820 [Rhodothermales bacterium]|nr:hypothetical protein [Rhodothermales bacterium]
MTTSWYRPGFALGLITALLMALSVEPAAAQDKEPVKVEKEIKVIVDDDGNVTVNGKPMSGKRMELDDGDRIVRKRVMRPGLHGPGGHGVRVFKMRDGDEEFEWSGDASERAHEAFVRMRDFDGMINDDYEFEFDFDHVNPEIMKMEAETRKLAREAARAEGSAKAQKEGQLEEKLSKLFEKKLEVRRKRIERLEERLSKARSELQERERARTEIIERRKSDLLGSDTLKW